MLTGLKLAHYEIQKKIGFGGMGEVYLAHDEKLDRKVALKVLLPEFCCNEERVQRFKQEARAASALNHPNIITIYEIGEEMERLFIATEYVDGVTLREKIDAGSLSIFDTLKIAEQVADALAVAHEAHIVHRDIKPENIMIWLRDSYVKILDFGLAKATLHPSSGTEDKTLQLIQTQAGMVMGSVRYMSPEQARGREIDGRSDIWSLGVVLYEMIAGTNPFAGETVSDSLAALIHIEPAVLEEVPVGLNGIVSKALRKKADDRYQNIKEFAADLKELRMETEQSSSGEREAFQKDRLAKTLTVKRQDTSENKTLIHQTQNVENNTDGNPNKTQVLSISKRRGINYLPFLILSLAALIALGAWYFQPFSKVKPANAFESVQISRITDSGKAGVAAISSDGKYVAFVNNEGGLGSLTVRQIATGSNIQVVPPTNLGFFAPTFSNDGNYIFYTLVDKSVGTLYQIPSMGGTPKKIIVDVDSKITFSPDGSKFAFIRHNPEKNLDSIIIADSDGTDQKEFINSGEAGMKKISEVSWSPVEDKFLVSAADKIYYEKMVSAKLILISQKDKKIEPVDNNIWLNANSFCWLKDGSGFFLLAKKSEEEQQQIWFLSYPEANARQITNDSSGYVMMSYAENSNTIAALKSDIISSLWEFNPQSKNLTQITSESRDIMGGNGVAEMPGGKLLVTKVEGTQSNLWIIDKNGKSESQLTKDAGVNLQPKITADGKYIVFVSNRIGDFSLWRMDIDGKNPVQLTNAPNEFAFRPEILPDSKTIIYERRFENLSKARLMKTTINGGESEEVFPDSETINVLPSVSQDGKLLAFTAQSFNMENLDFKSVLRIAEFKEGKFIPLQKETNMDAGYQYKWSVDNKNLFFVERKGVPNIFTGSADGSGQPKPLTNFNSGTILNFGILPASKTLYLVRGIINSDLILIKENAKTSQN